jgi:NADP-dependent 3-hydroxy acid dehydrogenase YdfG
LPKGSLFTKYICFIFLIESAKIAIIFYKTKEKELIMNKIVLITGATSGIGLGCARKFAENGDKVILTGRNEQRLSEIREELEAKGTKVLTLAFDVRDREKAKQAIDGLPEEWREIDVLVNNAGLALGLEPEYQGDLDDWETMIDTNIKGLLTMTRLVVPGMVERNRGQIINIGSVAGDAAYAGGNVYCATKAAVKALTDGLRIDVADTAIRVTNLKPGLVETNFSNIRFHGDSDRAKKLYTGIKPLTGDDIADVAVYAANAPAHVQIAEVLILATHQASGSVIVRK